MRIKVYKNKLAQLKFPLIKGLGGFKIMKNKIYILISILVLLFVFLNNVDAQNRKRVNFGFVFIDGKYISPPYIVNRRGLKLYLNNIKISERELATNPFATGDRRAVSSKITKYSTLSETLKLSGKYLNARSDYYFARYPYQQALDSTIESIRAIPSVKEVENSSWAHFKLYNGEEFNYVITTTIMKESNRWGPGGRKEKGLRKVAVKSLKRKAKYLRKELRNNKAVVMLLDNKGMMHSRLGIGSITAHAYTYHIMQQEKLTNEQKKDSLLLYFGQKETVQKFVNAYSITPQYIKRIKALGYDTLRYSHKK